MTQKVAYVTGGMGGIGTAICHRLAKSGFKVIAGCGPNRDAKKLLDEDVFAFFGKAAARRAFIIGIDARVIEDDAL